MCAVHTAGPVCFTTLLYGSCVSRRLCNSKWSHSLSITSLCESAYVHYIALPLQLHLPPSPPPSPPLSLGYHQKCHSPPIPASALELDTPWNCTYCLRGTKCPYLTESLEVLQNLLSDNEEGQSHDERDSVTTAESDEGGDDFTTPAPPQHGKLLAPPKPQKKRVWDISLYFNTTFCLSPGVVIPTMH